MKNTRSREPLFTCLPNWLRGKLTPNEGWLLWVLRTHYPNIFPSIETLAEEASMCPKTVTTTLKRLENLGLIVKNSPFKAGNRRRSNSYELRLEESVIPALLGGETPSSDDRSLVGDTRVGGYEIPSEVGRRYQRSLVRGTNKEEQSKKIQTKKNKSKKNLQEALSLQDPPLSPPMGGATGMVDPWLENFEPCKPVAENQPVEKLQAPPQAQPLLEAAKISEQAPAPDPIAVDPRVPASKPRARKRAAPFAASIELIPAALLPVKDELLNFWRAKRGEKSEGAWQRMIRNSSAIQADPRGGTEILRRQLCQGAEDGWQGISRANWEKYGEKAKSVAGTGVSTDEPPWRQRDLKGCELTQAAMALSQARDALRARRHGEAPQQASGAILGASHGVIDVEVVA